MSAEESVTALQSLQLVDISKQEKPNPCPDCGRQYTVGESIAVTVANRPQPVWEGCIDCWLRRTSPEMCQTFVKED